MLLGEDFDLSNQLDNFFQFSDPKLQTEFYRYCSIRKSTKMLSMFAVFSIVLLLPSNILSYFYTIAWHETIMTLFSVITIGLIALTAWTILIYQVYHKDLQGTKLHNKIPCIQTIFMMLLSLSLCFMTYRSFATEECTIFPKVLQQLLPGLQCETDRRMPGELIAFFVVSPIIFSVALCECRLYFILTWILFTSSVMTTVSILYQSNFTASILLWTFCIAVFIVELHMQKLSMFLTQYQLQESLLENERIADEQYSLELRHMIGNVAHDLKTVSVVTITIS